MLNPRIYLVLFMGLFIANPVSAEVSNHMNTIENNTALLIKRYFEEVWNKGDVDVLDEIMASSYINHNPGLEKPEPGPRGLKPIVIAIRTGFPDLKYLIQRMVVSEDFVAVHVLMTGTHTGNFFGIQATGKRINVSQMQIERIENGKLVEHWRVTDDMTR